MTPRFLLLCLTATLIAAGCGAPQRAPDTSANDPGRPETSGHKKSLIIAYGRAIPHIGPLEGGVAEFREIAQAGLLAMDPVTNQVMPRLAEEVPSTDRGTLRFLTDGRVETRYRLKPGIAWHDGTPFSAHDLVLGYHVQAEPTFPSRSSRTAGLVESMQVPDERSLVITWSSPTRLAL